MKNKKFNCGAIFVASITFNVFAFEITPEKMIFDLNEEATCIASANYLKHPNLNNHRNNFNALIEEYQVPQEMAVNMQQESNSEHKDFINKANKRYDAEVLPSMLLSAYTHRCLFMNGFEARKDFNAEPPLL